MAKWRKKIKKFQNNFGILKLNAADKKDSLAHASG